MCKGRLNKEAVEALPLGSVRTEARSGKERYDIEIRFGDTQVVIENEAFVESLRKLEERLAADALAIWAAFVGFCKEELMLEPEKKLVKVWFEPMLAEVERLKNLRKENPPEVDPEGLDEYARTLKELERSLRGD